MGWPIKDPSTIYAIRCTENGKVYIGRTQNLERRMREHLTELKKGIKDIGGRKNCGFQDDFNKYGESCFEVYILEENVYPEHAQERESLWIEEYQSNDPEYGYNRSLWKPPSGFAVKNGLPPNLQKEDSR